MGETTITNTQYEEATTPFVTTEKQVTTQKVTTQVPTTAKIETFAMTTETDGSGSTSAQPGLLPNPLIKPGQNGKLGRSTKNTGVQTSFVESRKVRESRRLKNQIRKLRNQLKISKETENRLKTRNRLCFTVILITAIVVVRREPVKRRWENRMIMIL